MKKILSLLLFLPLVALFASCDNDGKDIPNVSIGIEAENPVSDGVIYVVQGDTIIVNGIILEGQGDTQKVMTNSVNYYFDYEYVGTAFQPPFGIKILTAPDIPVGNHVLEMELPIFAVDKEVTTAYVQYPVTVVATAEDLPSGTTTTITTTAKTVQQK